MVSLWEGRWHSVFEESFEEVMHHMDVKSFTTQSSVELIH